MADMGRRQGTRGVRILDMTHVQMGPSATQILAWLGADVIKVELPGRGDITRSQLRDLPDVDSLYFTMLNCNKRSITINTKTEQGQQIFDAADRAVRRPRRELRSGRAGPAGLHLGGGHAINPRIVYASGRASAPGRTSTARPTRRWPSRLGGR